MVIPRLCDALRYSVPETPPPAPDPHLADDLAALLREGRFTDAAKLYAHATGAGLLESKLAVDRLARRHGLAPTRGCASHFAVLIAAAAALAGWLF